MAGRIVTVAQQKGGSGKTTLATHLAVASAFGDGVLGSGLKVAVMDCDPQGSLGEWFEAREQALGEEATHLHFATASGWGARREARKLARDYDLVIIDTPPKADLDARPAIDAADLVIVPVQPSPVDVWSTASTLELAAKEKSMPLLVLNRVPARAALTDEMAAAVAEYGARLAETRIGNRTAFASSLKSGRTALETERTGKAAAEARALAAELWEILARMES
jgi:chromosome partitioning protein